ncbi:MAG: DNA translocase FtsK 4TM domain-containing protein, partial [Anaerolineae bacterium]
MAKRSSRKKSWSDRLESVAEWFGWLASPLMQQTLAVLLILLSLLIFIALFNLTSGSWLDARVANLQFLFGWGVVPVALSLGVIGVVIILHHLDRPVAWRWRPVVGLELILFSLLALTHLIAGRSDPWGMIEAGWGGGVIGWAIAHTLSTYVGPLAAGALMAMTLLVGTGLAFDLTLGDVAQWFRRPKPQPTSHGRPQRSATSRRRSQPSPRQARPKPGQARPTRAER